MGTKNIIYVKGVVNPNQSANFYGYKFTYTKDLKPIPVKVPIEIADVLLQLKDSVSRCCYKKPKNLFEEV